MSMLRALVIATLGLAAAAGVVTAAEPEAPPTEVQAQVEGKTPASKQANCNKICTRSFVACIRSGMPEETCEAGLDDCVAVCDETP
jgi:hypothetical protein